jgi:hypothetical protein
MNTSHTDLQGFQHGEVYLSHASDVE